MLDTNNQRGTLNNGADPYIFPQNARVLDNTYYLKTHKWAYAN